MEALPFFEGFTYGSLVLGLVTAIVFFIPQAGVTFLNFLKAKFNLSGQSAQYFILALLTVISLVAMAVTGMFVDINWTLQSIITQVAAALVPAKLAYKKLKLTLPPNVSEAT